MEPIHVLLLLGIASMTVFGGFGAYIAGQKGRDEGEGMIFGALLGPIGLIVVAILPNVDKTKEAASPPVYQFKPRKMLGVVEESRGLRKID